MSVVGRWNDHKRREGPHFARSSKGHRGGINRVDGTCAIGMGEIERVEGASVMVVDE